jgi:hypothetical protein
MLAEALQAEELGANGGLDRRVRPFEELAGVVAE